MAALMIHRDLTSVSLCIKPLLIIFALRTLALIPNHSATNKGGINESAGKKAILPRLVQSHHSHDRRATIARAGLACPDRSGPHHRNSSRPGQGRNRRSHGHYHERSHRRAAQHHEQRSETVRDRKLEAFNVHASSDCQWLWAIRGYRHRTARWPKTDQRHRGETRGHE